jgi:hypothetical protein
MALTLVASPATSTGTMLIDAVAAPSAPKLPLPQHLTPPPLVSAQPWPPPAEIAVTPLVRPETPTGMLLLVVVSFPSWPVLFQPQHRTPPPYVSAQA